MPAPSVRFLSTCIVLVALFFTATAFGSERVLYNFAGGVDGGNPTSSLTFDHSGNAYGSTNVGGAYGCGVVYKLTQSGGNWSQSVLYSFTCFDDGKNPYGGVTLDASGNLYGTTVAGGSGGTCAGDGCGVVYKLTQSGGNWTESVLYNFTGGNDGYGPGGAVVFDNAGNLYGTTPDGGMYGVGVVYQLSLSGGHWTQKVLHAFTGGDDGGVGSLGALLLDNAGSLYGVTEIGGAYSAGTAFKLSPGTGGTWTLTTLYAFQGQPDAAFPYGGLIADSSGALYGTTYFGGTAGSGTVFELRPTPNIGGWKEVVLYSFRGGSDGGYPTSTLLFDAVRNLYGTTSNGGDSGCGCGVVFQLQPTGSLGWREVVLHTFMNSDGAYPSYGVTGDSSGNLYGATPLGGTHGQGVAFEVSP